MLEIRKAAKLAYKEMIGRGIPENSSRWAVLDAVSILVSLEKSHWIRLNPMDDSGEQSIPNSLLEIDWIHADPRCLAWIYSDLMNPETKAKTASIYTPDSVVYFMVRSALILSIKDSCGVLIPSGDDIPIDKESALSVLRAISKLTIADPCVGCGLFLYEAWLQLCEIEDRMTAIVDPNKLKSKRVVSLDQLHGVDINPEAIEISKRLLQFAWRSTKR